MTLPGCVFPDLNFTPFSTTLVQGCIPKDWDMADIITTKELQSYFQAMKNSRSAVPA